MRLIGLILVALGALVLGVQGLGSGTGSVVPAQSTAARIEQAGWLSPVVGGIALVSGLILLATGTRRE